MPFKILVVDDMINDPGEEIHALPELLRKAGYEVSTTANADRAYDLFWEYHPDLVVLDIMFGDAPIGVEICEAIRQSEDDTPIILVTRFRKETKEILHGFEAGADDYVILPCDNLEIMARIRANLPPEVVIVDDYIQVDFRSSGVWIHRDADWQEIRLSPRLWRLLDVLLLNAGITVVTTTIKDRVWGKTVSDGVLFRAVYDLRQKLEPDPSHPAYVDAVWSIGYRFNGTPVRASSTLPAGQIQVSTGSNRLNTPGRSGKRSAAAKSDVVLRARLMAYAGAAVDRLLAGGREKQDLAPDDIEQLVRAAGQYMMEHFVSVLVGE